MTTTFIALLRGVNVGRNTLKMERLRQILLEMGLQNPRTYVQSGNVLFDSQGTNPPLAQDIERQLAAETRLPVTVILRTAAELRRIAAGNPFLKLPEIDKAKLHVTFLSGTASGAAMQTLSAIKAGDDELRVVGQQVYLHCPNGYGGTKLSNNQIERTLGVRATTRNWNTVIKLNELAASV